MNIYLIFVIGVLVLGYSLELVAALATLRSLDPRLPEEFQGVYSEEDYATSQDYTRMKTRFGLIQSTIVLVLTLAMILLGGFNWLDIWVRSAGCGELVTGLLFMGALFIGMMALNLPFSLYHTFVIEERFGFNTTTVQTFLADLLKSILLSVVLGGGLLALVLWFFQTGGTWAWAYSWAMLVFAMLVLQFVAPVWIMPLFNRFTPLEEGELKEQITTYAKKQNFGLEGIYTMDGSKRSKKANAFFTGFGRFRRIVFFDTLLETLSPREVLAVLAHEMGHFTCRHIQVMLAASIIQMGVMFFILGLFIKNQGLFAAFSMEYLSIYASLVFFSFLYSPLSLLLVLGGNYISRKNEYEADRFAASTTGDGQALIDGLKTLSKDNLANLTPHPLQVILQYSHPPILERITALRAWMKTGV